MPADRASRRGVWPVAASWLLAVLLNSVPLYAETEPIVAKQYSPLFPPGYRPAEDTDEGGLWMVMDKYENALANSAMLTNDPLLQEYLEYVVCKLAPDYCNEVRVYIVDNPHFNASMAPNGVMQVHTGLLLRLENEAQLASILGHELAHYFRKHTLGRWRTMKSTSAVANFLGAGFGSAGSLIGLGVMSSVFSYSRSQETEADMYGLELIYAAGYKPEAAPRVWQLVVAEEDRAQYKRKRRSFTASHPMPEKRVTALNERAAGLSMFATDSVSNTEHYQKNISQIYSNAMGALVKSRQFGRIEYLLERHKNSAMPRGPYYYLKGELHRHRKEENDMSLAVEAYEQSLRHDGPPEAHRDLGYCYWKISEKEKAREAFRQYLDKMPDASDRAMIQFYFDKEERK